MKRLLIGIVMLSATALFVFAGSAGTSNYISQDIPKESKEQPKKVVLEQRQSRR